MPALRRASTADVALEGLPTPSTNIGDRLSLQENPGSLNAEPHSPSMPLAPTAPSTSLDARSAERPICQPDLDPPPASSVHPPIDPNAIIAELQESMRQEELMRKAREKHISRSPSFDPWDIQLPHPLSREPSVGPSPLPSPAASPSRHLSNLDTRDINEREPIAAGDSVSSKKRKAPGQKTKNKTKKGKKGRPAAKTAPAPDDVRPAKRARTSRVDDNTASASATVSARQTRASVKASTTSVAENSPVSASLSHSALNLPLDAPDWLKNAMSMMAAVNLGSKWSQLLRAWLDFETHEGWSASSRLKTTHRPAAIAQWVRRARSPTWRPAIRNGNSYGRDHAKWWESLQPAWRFSKDGSLNTKATIGDWETLRKPGINGLLSVLASLFYWGLVVKAAGKGLDDWSVSISDCLLCLNKLA